MLLFLLLWNSTGIGKNAICFRCTDDLGFIFKMLQEVPLSFFKDCMSILTWGLEYCNYKAL